MTKTNRKNNYIFDIAVVAMCVALLSISAWIVIPVFINFTLQTLVIFTVSSLFGLKLSLASVFAYIALGACGLPVFSAFGAGLSAIIGPTGGYILGFIFIPLTVNLLPQRNKYLRFLSMLCGLLLCYLCGTLWFALVYSETLDGILSVLGVCVFPFIVPDVLKIIVAVSLSGKLKKHPFFNRIGGHNG